MSDTDPVEAITPDEPARWGEAAYNPETDSPPDDHHHQDDEDPEDLGPELGGD